VLAVPTLTWAPAVPVSLGLGFLYTLANATGRPALLSILSSVSNEARGAVLGLNVSFSSIGWLAATALGGTLVALGGFGSLGVLTAAFGVLGAVLTLLNWLLPRVSVARPRPAIAPQER
jgi:predicted MFS family arabinose efflux permease